MNDLISRQAAIAHAVPLNLFGREVMMVSVSELENLPSAQPERPKGEWITDDLSGLIYCSRCGNVAPVDTTGGRQYKSNFCPTCGADMRGEQMETDVVAVFKMLKAAYDTLEEWSKRSEQDE